MRSRTVDIQCCEFCLSLCCHTCSWLDIHIIKSPDDSLHVTNNVCHLIQTGYFCQKNVTPLSLSRLFPLVAGSGYTPWLLFVRSLQDITRYYLEVVCQKFDSLLLRMVGPAELNLGPICHRPFAKTPRITRFSVSAVFGAWLLTSRSNWL